MTNINIANFGHMVGFGSAAIDRDLANHFNRLTSTDSSLRNSIAELILGLKQDGVWPFIEQLCVVHDVDADSLLNLTGGTDASKVGSPTFTADRGYTTVSTTAYIDSGYNEGSTTLWAQHDAHCFVYNRTVDASGTLFRTTSGAQDSAITYTDTPNPDEARYTAQATIGSARQITTAQNTPIGFNGMSILANNNRLSRLNDTTGTNSFTESYTLGTDDIEYGAVGAQQIAAWGFGGGLTATQLGLYENRIRKFMQDRGADVY